MMQRIVRGASNGPSNIDTLDERGRKTERKKSKYGKGEEKEEDAAGRKE